MKPTVLITGASSYLAHRLIPIAAQSAAVFGVARNADSVIHPSTPIEFDLVDTDKIETLIDSVRPTAIIHAAAVNPGDGEFLMDAVNHLASARLAEVAAKNGIRYIMVSTESVHSGLCAPYADDAIPDPINAYGRSKAAGELAVMLVNPDAVIVRTSLIYGLEKIDRGTRGFRDRLLRGDTLELFEDVYRQPVWVDSLSHALCDLAFNQRDINGTLNLVGDETMSRAEFGLALLAHWGVETSGKVSLCSGAARTGVQPDLSCTCQRANVLSYARPGVTEVLASATRQ